VIAVVPAIIFGSIPNIYSRGTTNTPPALPIKPARNPNTSPLNMHRANLVGEEKSVLAGFLDRRIITDAPAVVIAKIIMMTLVGAWEFTTAPPTAETDIAADIGIAMRQLTRRFLIYVNAADEVVTILSKSPSGIASVLNFSPSQNSTGTYNCAPPSPNIANNSERTKNTGGIRYQ